MLHGGSQQTARAVSGQAVVSAVETRILVGIRDIDNLLRLQHSAADSLRRVEPQHFLAARRHLGKQLGSRGVEQKMTARSASIKPAASRPADTARPPDR